jgi:phage terminase large subunit GpA-like protein
MSETTWKSSPSPGSSFAELAAFDGAEAVLQAWLEGLAPDPALTVSEWADQHRVLSSRASAEPGRYRTDRTPPMRAIMDALSPSHPAERVVLMKAAQVGATEAGNNWIGFVIDRAPGPMLAVQPTVELAKRNSRQRIDPLIEESPRLRERVRPSRSRDAGNTVLSKEFPGGILVLTGANSAVGLRSIPARYLFLDEVDAYPPTADQEGDPVGLAEARSLTFAHRRKIFLVSTPTVKGFSRIERAYEASDKRRYLVPCPHCGHRQWLHFKGLRWEPGRPESVHYVCEGCEGRIEERHKTAMLAEGSWEPTAEAEDPKTVGFHLSALYSPVGWYSWERLVRAFLEAKQSPETLRTWINTVLGETWEDASEGVDAHVLMGRQEDWGELAPAGVLVITCGVDVQDDRVEVERIGWGLGEESWSLEHRIIYGDPSAPQLWRQLDDCLLERTETRAGHRLPVSCTCIDSGGHHAQAVYDFVRDKFGRRVYAIKGMAGAGRPVWPKRASRNNKGRINLFLVGVDAAKDSVMARLRIAEPGPGYCHLPKDREAQWFEQLTAERVQTRYHRGFARRVWVKPPSARNEALDCRTYGYAALLALNVAWGRLQANLQRSLALQEGGEVPPPPAPRQRLRRRSRGSRRVVSPYMRDWEL